MGLVSVANLTAHYGDKPVLWDVHYESPENSIIGIIGPNGAGKSTFLKVLLGLKKATSGRVLIEGLPPERQRHRISYVPQRQSVDWNYPLTTHDLTLMGLYREIGWFRRIRTAHKERAMEALEKVKMQDYAHTQIGELSGGQQQRIFFARALVQKADIYFLDEPLAGVDKTTEQLIFSLLQDLQKEGKTVFMVHHDLRTVPDIFHHVLLLNSTLIATGKMQQVFTPENIEKTFGRMPVFDMPV